MTHRCPAGVNINDGDEQRTERTWIVWDRGRWRELRLQVGRGYVADPVREPRNDRYEIPRPGREL